MFIFECIHILTFINESCHTHVNPTWQMYVWLRQGIYRNTSGNTYIGMHHVTHMNEFISSRVHKSCHTCEPDMSDVWMQHIIYMHHVTDDDCFYYHSWRNNVVITFGTLASFLTSTYLNDLIPHMQIRHVTLMWTWNVTWMNLTFHI